MRISFSKIAILTLLPSILLAAAIPAVGQITSISNITSTPVMGVGHDYIHDLNETVNPANGSVSIRIAAPTTSERGLNFPVYAYTYDTNGLINIWFQPTVSTNCNTASVDQLCYEELDGPYTKAPQSWPHYPDSVTSQAYTMTYKPKETDPPLSCSYLSDFIYVDPEGGRHALGLLNAESPNCSTDFDISSVSAGGDESYKATTAGSTTDSHGDILGYGLLSEDTNGNYRNGTGRPWSTTYNAQYNPTSMTIPGWSTAFAYNYTNVSSSFNLNSTLVASVSSNTSTAICNNDPNNPTGAGWSSLSQLTLPTKQTYKFSYDSQYGFIGKITYPTGAWVQYTWGMNNVSDMAGFISTKAVAYYGSGLACYYKHDWPAVTKRVVSYDGTNPALEQDFTYSTTWPASGAYWTSKTTTVVTKDLVTSGHPSTTTIYTYLPQGQPSQSSLSTEAPQYLPVESSITYEDSQNKVLRTVTKVWNSANQLAAQCETLPSGLVSGKFYQYEAYTWPASTSYAGISTTTDQVTDLAEYDYGKVTSSCQRPSTTPTRETTTQYHSFANTPLWPIGSYILDRPQTVKVFDNGTLSSETDYVYDQGSSGIAPVTPNAIGHDPTNYAASSTLPRGNVTKVTRKCFVGATSCADSVTTANYDETGRPVNVTDARGYVTSYSFADGFTTDDGSPTGNTNTYLTKITRPATNGTNHTESFLWDYNKGELRQLTDVENSQTTYYTYEDDWNRPASIATPDGGMTGISYADGGPQPTVTTTKSVSSTTQEKSVVTMDAYGHPTSEQITTYPGGTLTTITTFDGLGRVMTVTNPYWPTSESSNGKTSYVYDALNRKTQQTQPDGSTLQWCYDGIPTTTQTTCSTSASSLTNASWIDFRDGNGNHSQQTYDGLGRMTSVVEPNSTTNALAMETDYTNDASGNLLKVIQKGLGGSDTPRVRTFTYDSLSRLISAANPETGTIGYSYDPNGNLQSKTDARNITTSYTYDALNRIVSKSYTNDPSSTPASCYQYDTSSQAGTGANLVGRLANEWTQSACPNPIVLPATGTITSRLVLAYDPIGRISVEQQCASGQCTSTSGPKLSYGYDLAGDVTSLTNSAGTSTGQLILTTGFDAAAHMNSIVSSWTAYPTNLYTLSTGGYGPVGPLNWNLGPNLAVNKSYTNRLQVTSMSVTGQLP